MQRYTVDELCEAVAHHHRTYTHKRRQPIVRGTRALLTRLERYPGETWEERWLASGNDAAPLTWMDHYDLPNYNRWSPTLLAMNALLQIRVLRPSYSWLLDSRGKINTAQFINAAGGEALDELRLLPAYQAALLRQQHDTEAGLARIMIRTGKSIRQITGDDLLFYADVVKTSGRQRREHLMWELLVQLGPLAAEAPTLRAAWSAKGNSRQHSTATLVDRYGIPASGVRNLLVDYLEEIRHGMDYGSLEGFAYRLARLFWWQVLQINPDQADLRLSSEVATAWREQLATTTDGRERRGDPLDPVCDPRLLPGLGRMVSRRSGALGGVGSPVPCAPDAEPCRCQKQASAAKRYAKPHPRAHTVITDLCRRSKSPKAPHCRAFGTRTGMRRWPSVRGRRFGLPA
ncbi:hypothetical protein MAUB1S_00960 [Mycolicibacterium aubagnense]